MTWREYLRATISESDSEELRAFVRKASAGQRPTPIVFLGASGKSTMVQALASAVQPSKALPVKLTHNFDLKCCALLYVDGQPFSANLQALVKHLIHENVEFSGGLLLAVQSEHEISSAIYARLRPVRIRNVKLWRGKRFNFLPESIRSWAMLQNREEG